MFFDNLLQFINIRSWFLHTCAIEAPTIVMSLHDDQTWAVSSTSHRQPSTYSPGGVSDGMRRTSTTEMANGRSPEHRLVLPGSFTELQGGLNSYSFKYAPIEPVWVPSGSGFTARVIPTGTWLSAVMAATLPLA